MSDLKHIPTWTELRRDDGGGGYMNATYYMAKEIEALRTDRERLHAELVQCERDLAKQKARAQKSEDELAEAKHERDAIRADAEAYRAAKNEFLEQARRNLLGIGDIDKARGVK